MVRGLATVVICAACAAVAHASSGGAAAAGLAPKAGVRAAARPGMFAAASAPFARRQAPELRDEWRFLKDTAAAGEYGGEAARLALAKSGDPQVRTLAATLMNHHASTQAAVQQMLNTRRMARPMLSGEQRKSLNHLAKLHGAKFDREWLETVGLRSQQDDVAAFERAAASVRDPALRSWIARTLPTMRYQLASAERVVTGGTKFASLAPELAPSAIKSPGPSQLAAAPNPADLGEGNMLLGPARPVAAKFSEPGSR